MAANDPLRNFRYRLEIDGIVQVAFQVPEAKDRALQARLLAHHLAGCARVTPKVGILGALVQLGPAQCRVERSSCRTCP